MDGNRWAVNYSHIGNKVILESKKILLLKLCVLVLHNHLLSEVSPAISSVVSNT